MLLYDMDKSNAMLSPPRPIRLFVKLTCPLRLFTLYEPAPLVELTYCCPIAMLLSACNSKESIAGASACVNVTVVAFCAVLVDSCGLLVSVLDVVFVKIIFVSFLFVFTN